MLEEYIEAEISHENINFWFNYLLNKISNQLKRKPLEYPYKILFLEDDSFESIENIAFDFGVNRISDKRRRFLKVNYKIKNIIKFILLREVFYCFLPISLRNYSMLKVLVLVIVSEISSKYPNYDEWEEICRDNSLYAYYKLRIGEVLIKNIKNIFDYIHKYSFLFLNLDEQADIITDLATDQIMQKHFEKEDELEFFSLIFRIFNIKKRYTRRRDFEDIFKELTLNEKLKTTFTLKKFTRFFKNFLPSSVISPNYQINWRFFSCQYFYCYLFFNPQIGNYKVQKILKYLPFYYASRTYESKFVVEVSGYFIIPINYLEDLKKYFRSLKNYGIVRKYFLFNIGSHENFLNLNYFKKRIFDKKLLLRKDKDYDENLIFSPSVKYISRENYEIDLLDIIIINRIRWFSTTGFSFEQKWKQLTKVKSDIFHYLLTQKNNINDLKKILNLYYSNPELKQNVLEVINSYKEFGFFYMKEQITTYLKLINLIENIINTNPDIINEIILFKNIKNYGIGPKLDENLEYKYFQFKENLQNLFFEYFNKNSKYNEIKNNYQNYLNLLEIVEKLKIFNLKVIETILKKKEIAENIYSSKIQKIQKILKEYRLKKIKFQDIDDRLSQIVNSDPPGAVPFLITSISTRSICPILYNLLIKDTIDVEQKINYLKDIFPRVVKIRVTDMISRTKYLQLDLYSMDLNDNEKLNLLGFIKSIFNQNIITFRQNIASYIIQVFSFEDFFDVENNKFFYTKDLFEELSKYSLSLVKNEKIFSDYKTSRIEEVKFNNNLINKISFDKYAENLKPKKDLNLDLKIFQKIEALHENLENEFLKNNDFSNIIKYFKFIKKINFFPAYQNFGLDNYYLYLKPNESNEIDWKMLFPLGFKNLKHTATLESSNSYLFQYIFPSKNPNFSYLNWLVKSKKNIDEYFSFSIKQIIPILNFNFNLGPNGFYFGYQTFEIIIQQILFNKSFDPPIQPKYIDVSDKAGRSIKGEYNKDLQTIIDLLDHSFINIIKLRHKSKLNTIKELIYNKLIYPYIKLKENTGLKFKFYAILPGLTSEQIDKIVKIFHFLNYGFIYKIQGEFYLKEDNKTVKFENGLYLKFYLPDSAFNHFKQIVINLFNFFKIKHYLIFFDLIKGDLFVNNLFDKFKHPNPMGCHFWDDHVKKWRNHKSLTQKFEFIYPENQGNDQYYT